MEHRMAARGSILLTLSLSLCPCSLVRADEASMYVITNWPSSPIPPYCGYHDPLPSLDDMVEGWLDVITSDSSWSEGEYEVDDPILENWCTDDDLDPQGRDDEHLDDCDAALIAWHAGAPLESGERSYRGRMRELATYLEDCNLRQNEMELGDADLEFLNIVGCDSLRYDSTYTDTWETWKDTFEGLHQLTGFHGKAFVDNNYYYRYLGAADDGLDESIADGWVDNLTVYRGGGFYQCPVAMVAGGIGRDTAANRASNETYVSGLVDPPDDPTNWAYVYVGGCYSTSGALPQ